MLLIFSTHICQLSQNLLEKIIRRVGKPNSFITGKIEKPDFEMPIIPQTVNINNQRTTRVKSINLEIIRKLIQYSLKNVAIKAMLTSTVFEILMSEGRSVLSPPQRGAESERVNYRVPFFTLSLNKICGNTGFR